MKKPHALFDFLKQDSGLKSDAALAKALKITAPTISKMRSGKLKVGADLVLRIHLATEMPVREILEMLKQNQSIKDVYEEE